MFVFKSVGSTGLRFPVAHHLASHVNGKNIYFLRCPLYKAGAGGFEPPNAGTKNL